MRERFWSTGGGSGDTVFWLPVFGMKDGFVRKRLVMPIYRVGRAFSKAKWWLLHRFSPRHQYNIIRTELPPGYYDEDILILHGAFAMLVRYVEGEGGPEALEAFNVELRERPDPNAPDGIQEAQADRQAEAVALYRWWKIEKPADEARRDELLSQLYGSNRSIRPSRELKDEERALAAKIDDDEQMMLHRLIDIRRSLWS